MSISNIKLNFFHPYIIFIIVFKDIMPYFSKWPPLKNRTSKKFIIANFGQSINKYWLKTNLTLPMLRLLLSKAQERKDF